MQIERGRACVAVVPLVRLDEFATLVNPITSVACDSVFIRGRRIKQREPVALHLFHSVLPFSGKMTFDLPLFVRVSGRIYTNNLALHQLFQASISSYRSIGCYGSSRLFVPSSQNLPRPGKYTVSIRRWGTKRERGLKWDFTEDYGKKLEKNEEKKRKGSGMVRLGTPDLPLNLTLAINRVLMSMFSDGLIVAIW